MKKGSRIRCRLRCLCLIRLFAKDPEVVLASAQYLNPMPSTVCSPPSCSSFVQIVLCMVYLIYMERKRKGRE